MTATGTLLGKYRSSTYNYIKTTSHPLHRRQRRQTNLPTPHRYSTLIPIDKLTMSNALVRELDLKMQQMKEYGLIAHGYQNENFQYPIHVRRSHDGEKVPQTLPILNKHRTNRFNNTTVLISSSHENQTSSKTKKKTLAKKSPISDEQCQTQRTFFVVPPNKTIDDIDPSLDRDQSFTTGKALTRFYSQRKSSSSSANSSPILCSLRPHSIACLSTTDTIATESSSESTKTDEQLFDPLSNSSQSLMNQTTSRTPIRTITQKFFSKLFHSPSKS